MSFNVYFPSMMLHKNPNLQNKKHNESTLKTLQKEIIRADLLVKAYLQDIRECTGPTDVLHRLNREISENMKIMKSGIDALEMLAREQDKESDRNEILKDVNNYLKQFASNQVALRQANLTCQALIDKQSKEELFETTGAAVPRMRVRADKASLSKQSSSITDSLVALNNMMSVQVKQSEESLHTLVNSSTAVVETKEEFKSMGTDIRKSKTLVQKYGRREVTDRVLIVIAAIFFFIIVLYVVQKRLF